MGIQWGPVWRQRQGIGFLPNDFDFSHATLQGYFGTYQFEKTISPGGSQGHVMLFSDGAQTVVFKGYRIVPHQSTQLNPDTYDPWEAARIEMELLSFLGNMTRIAAIMKLEREGVMEISHKAIFFDGKELHLADFEKHFRSSDSLASLVGSDALPFPLEVDRICAVTDDKGRTYLPFEETSRSSLFKIFTDDPPLRPELSVYGFIEGESLDRLLRRGGMDAEKRESLARELFRSAMVTHGYGILHRDLKPPNIIVTPAGRVNLADFGIAHRFFPSDRFAFLTATAHIEPRSCRMRSPTPKQLQRYLALPLQQKIEMEERGTSPFPYFREWGGSRLFAPKEVYSGRSKNKDDIYAVGLTAAVILTGRHPFLRPDDDAYPFFSGRDTSSSKEQLRAYRSLLERALKAGPEREQLLHSYQRFLTTTNDPFLHSIASCFHPYAEHRPARMVHVAGKLGLAYPPYPFFFHGSEMTRQGHEAWRRSIAGCEGDSIDVLGWMCWSSHTSDWESLVQAVDFLDFLACLSNGALEHFFKEQGINKPQGLDHFHSSGRNVKRIVPQTDQ